MPDAATLDPYLAARVARTQQALALVPDYAPADNAAPHPALSDPEFALPAPPVHPALSDPEFALPAPPVHPALSDPEFALPAPPVHPALSDPEFALPPEVTTTLNAPLDLAAQHDQQVAGLTDEQWTAETEARAAQIAADQPKQGVAGAFAENFMHPIKAVGRGPGLLVADDWRLIDHLESEYAKTSLAPETTGPGKVAGFAGGLASQVVQAAALGMVSGPVGIAGMFGSQGGYDAAVGAYSRARAAGFTPEQALGIAKNSASVGAGVQAIIGAMIPGGGKAPSMSQALKTGALLGPAAAAGQGVQNISERLQDVPTPIQQGMMEQGLTMGLLPAGTHAVGTALGWHPRTTAASDKTFTRLLENKLPPNPTPVQVAIYNTEVEALANLPRPGAPLASPALAPAAKAPDNWLPARNDDGTPNPFAEALDLAVQTPEPPAPTAGAAARVALAGEVPAAVAETLPAARALPEQASAASTARANEALANPLPESRPQPEAISPADSTARPVPPSPAPATPLRVSASPLSASAPTGVRTERQRELSRQRLAEDTARRDTVGSDFIDHYQETVGPTLENPLPGRNVLARLRTLEAHERAQTLTPDGARALRDLRERVQENLGPFWREYLSPEGVIQSAIKAAPDLFDQPRPDSYGKRPKIDAAAQALRDAGVRLDPAQGPEEFYGRVLEALDSRAKWQERARREAAQLDAAARETAAQAQQQRQTYSALVNRIATAETPDALGAMMSHEGLNEFYKAAPLDMQEGLHAAFQRRQAELAPLATADQPFSLGEDYANWQRARLRVELQKAQEKAARLQPLAEAALRNTTRRPNGELDLKSFKALPSAQMQSVFDHMQAIDDQARILEHINNTSSVVYPGVSETHIRAEMKLDKPLPNNQRVFDERGRDISGRQQPGDIAGRDTAPARARASAAPLRPGESALDLLQRSTPAPAGPATLASGLTATQVTRRINGLKRVATSLGLKPEDWQQLQVLSASLGNSPRLRVSASPRLTIADATTATAKLARRLGVENIMGFEDKPLLTHQGRVVEARYDRANGRILLNVAHLASPEAAQAKLLHEAVGHYGVERVLGQYPSAAFHGEMRRLYDGLNPKDRALLDQVAERYGANIYTDAGLTYAMSELVAKRAEAGRWGTTARALLSRAARWLNENLGTKLSTDEVAELLVRARQYLERQDSLLDHAATRENPAYALRNGETPFTMHIRNVGTAVHLPGRGWLDPAYGLPVAAHALPFLRYKGPENATRLRLTRPDGRTVMVNLNAPRKPFSPGTPNVAYGSGPYTQAEWGRLNRFHEFVGEATARPIVNPFVEQQRTWKQGEMPLDPNWQPPATELSRWQLFAENQGTLFSLGAKREIRGVWQSMVRSSLPKEWIFYTDNRTYDVASQTGARAAAKAIVADPKIGPAQAENFFFRPPPDLPAAVQGSLFEAIIGHHEAARREAVARGDTAAAEAAGQAAARFASAGMETFTSAGQMTSMLRGWWRLSPEGVIQSAANILEGANRKTLDAYSGFLDRTREALQQAHQEALRDTLTDKNVQAVAERALETAVIDSAETKAATKDLSAAEVAAEPGTRAAAAATGGNADQILDLIGRHYEDKSPGKTALATRLANEAGADIDKALGFARWLDRRIDERASLYGAVRENVLQRVFNDKAASADLESTAARYGLSVDELRNELVDHYDPGSRYQFALGKEVGEELQRMGAKSAEGVQTLARKLMAKGMPEADALAFARRMDARVQAVTVQQRKSISGRIRKIRGEDKAAGGASVPASGTPDLPVGPAVEPRLPRAPFPLPADAKLDAAIRAQLRARQEQLGRAVAQARDGRLAGPVADTIAQASGLTGPAADALRGALHRRFEALATARKQAILTRLTADEKQGRVRRTLRARMNELVKLHNAGALDGPAYRDAVRQVLGLRSLTEAEAARLRSRAETLQAIPEDQLARKQEATLAVLNELEKLRPHSKWDYPMAVWYSHILSGPVTHAVNMAGNALEFGTSLAAQMLTAPRSLPTLLPAMQRGLAKGWDEALNTLRTGHVSGERMTKFSDPKTWQRVDSKWLLPWKMVGRALAAEDLLFFHAESEVRQAALARRMAQEEGLSWQAAQRRVGELLAEPERANAAAQADSEGYTGPAARRRAREILQAQRDANGDFTETGRDFALRTTFNNKPYGALGVLAEAVKTAQRAEQTKLGTPILRLVAPFVDIVANVANASLNYTPIGAMRGLTASRGGHLYGDPVQMDRWGDRQAIHELYAKAAVGTALLTALALQAAGHKDDDDPSFWINGTGPKDASKRKTWSAAGNLPNSIRVNGRSYSYLNTPLAVPLGILGRYLDAVRYGHFKDADLFNRVAYVIPAAADTIVQQSFLDGLARLTGSIEQANERNFGENALNWLARTGSSFAVPNALKWADTVFDDTKSDAHGIAGAVLSQIPFARANLKPALNGLGEPITRPWTERFTKAASPDPVWRTLGELNLGLYPTRLEWHKQGLTDDQIYDVVKFSGPLIRQALEAKQSTASLAADEATQTKAAAILKTLGYSGDTAPRWATLTALHRALPADQRERLRDRISSHLIQRAHEAGKRSVAPQIFAEQQAKAAEQTRAAAADQR